MDSDYEAFIVELIQKGFEIAFHNAGSGAFSREETIKALELFTKKLGIIPRLHINHYKNIENIYWGNKRFYPPVQWLYNAVRPWYKPEGEVLGSPFFWGDICKKYMKYIRNRVFSGINTLAYDRKMPYREKKKDKYSNYWFSSSDGANINVFNKLLCKKNVDKLVAQGGCCIIYTHFANGFVESAFFSHP